MYRTIDCATWDDPWFADLDPHAKLLFLYFLTNRRSTAAGCFEITLRAMAFETGMTTGDVERHLGELSSRIQWFPQHQVIFVRNFYRHQSGNSNRANFRSSALKVLAEMPVEVQATVVHVYPELTVEGATLPQPIPIPSPTLGDKEKEEETVEVEVTEAEEGEEANAPAREEPIAPPSKAQKPTVLEVQPFEYIVAMCEATGTDVSELTAGFKDRQGAVAKRLRKDGISPHDAGRCVQWLMSQSWRSSGVDLFTVEKEYGGWVLAGKPAIAKPKGNSRASPFAGIDEFEQRVNGTHETEPEYVEATWRST